MRMNRKPIPSKKIHEVFLKTNGHCFYCKHELPEDTPYYDERGNEVMRARNWDVDHIIPVSRGGGDEIGNLVPACKSCNQAKGAK